MKKIILIIILLIFLLGCAISKQPCQEVKNEKTQTNIIIGNYTIGKFCIEGFVYYVINGCCNSGLTQAMGMNGLPIRCEE